MLCAWIAEEFAYDWAEDEEVNPQSALRKSALRKSALRKSALRKSALRTFLSRRLRYQCSSRRF